MGKKLAAWALLGALTPMGIGSYAWISDDAARSSINHASVRVEALFVRKSVTYGEVFDMHQEARKALRDADAEIRRSGPIPTFPRSQGLKCVASLRSVLDHRITADLAKYAEASATSSYEDAAEAVHRSVETRAFSRYASDQFYEALEARNATRSKSAATMKESMAALSKAIPASSDACSGMLAVRTASLPLK